MRVIFRYVVAAIELLLSLLVIIFYILFSAEFSLELQIFILSAAIATLVGSLTLALLKKSRWIFQVPMIIIPFFVFYFKSASVPPQKSSYRPPETLFSAGSEIKVDLGAIDTFTENEIKALKQYLMASAAWRVKDTFGTMSAYLRAKEGSSFCSTYSGFIEKKELNGKPHVDVRIWFGSVYHPFNPEWKMYASSTDKFRPHLRYDKDEPRGYLSHIQIKTKNLIVEIKEYGIDKELLGTQETLKSLKREFDFVRNHQKEILNNGMRINILPPSSIRFGSAPLIEVIPENELHPDCQYDQHQRPVRGWVNEGEPGLYIIRLRDINSKKLVSEYTDGGHAKEYAHFDRDRNKRFYLNSFISRIDSESLQQFDVELWFKPDTDSSERLLSKIYLNLPRSKGSGDGF